MNCTPKMSDCSSSSRPYFMLTICPTMTAICAVRSSPEATTTAPAMPSVRLALAMRCAECRATTWPISCPSTPASCPSVSSRSNSALVIKTGPPGRAKALMVCGSASRVNSNCHSVSRAALRLTMLNPTSSRYCCSWGSGSAPPCWAVISGTACNPIAISWRGVRAMY